MAHDRKDEFEQVALPFIDSLYNLALNLTRNPKDAEDLVQETFLRAYRFFDSYRSGTHIRAWLFRILRNSFINRYRSSKNRPEEVDFAKLEESYERMVDDDFLRNHQPMSPEQAVMHGVMDEEVRSALDAIPDEYRVVVVMALVEEMSYKEIAASLSIPLGTVMSRLHRGRKLLQTSLVGYARRRGILKPTADVSLND